MGADVSGKARKIGGGKPNGAPAGAGPGQPFWANFGTSLNQQSKNWGDGVNRWWTNVSTQTKGWKAPKWEMPACPPELAFRIAIAGCGLRTYSCRSIENEHDQVIGMHVDVDFLGPAVLSVKKSARDFYVRLPPPLQQGLPYFAVGATTGIIVWKIQGARLRGERKITDKLQTRVESLLEERDKLQNTVKELRNKTIAPRSASDMKMAAAVAEATNAAAAAATAAASAASRCSVVVRRPPEKGQQLQD